MLFPYWHTCVHLVKTRQMESLQWHCQMKQSENDLEIKRNTIMNIILLIRINKYSSKRKTKQPHNFFNNLSQSFGLIQKYSDTKRRMQLTLLILTCQDLRSLRCFSADSSRSCSKWTTNGSSVPLEKKWNVRYK